MTTPPQGPAVHCTHRVNHDPVRWLVTAKRLAVTTEPEELILLICRRCGLVYTELHE